ncbi:helix-turn-helix domain-containing protein [Chryseobacterium sp. SSA4.19]|uniref:helix-turn-helix transcriptional regulator n=1 Tax=unclassified Chryseobacterium TaxID=2593645 RepID=UPI001F4E93CE|nr:MULTISPECIES: helix-turn-helix transcriptional regulator [unclassified Chryseobacterium]MCJ8154160.1 helix-turn-helix domain-containing protein [Chryseobacterium sp. SSA4.19]
MNYQTFEPDQDLTTFIRCYWTLESPKEETPEKQTIVPDGCMEMIFHYGDLYKQYLNNGNSIIQPRCFVIGQLTRPLDIEPTGETGIFSVRFHPEGFLPFTINSIKEMENTAVSLEKLFGKDGQEIEQQVLNANSILEKIKIVEKFLLDRLTDIENIDRIVKSTVETIITANGQLSVDELSTLTQVNRRQLLRKFSSAIGLSPKQLSRTIRLQAALKMLLNDQFSNLAELAYENEYYDQAHFIKEFKEFTGSTPKEFYGTHLKMSSLFYGTD